MDVEQRLRGADTRRPAVDADAALRRVRWVHGRRRTRMRTVASVATALVAVIGFGLVSGNDRPTGVATGESEPDGAPTPGAPAGWAAMSDSPLSARVGPAAVATENEFVIWGGRAVEPFADGAAYDFESDEWRMMSASPLPAQADATAVWTGAEVVVWGGIGQGGESTGAIAGAAWDPVTDEWRTVPNELGLGASRPLTGATWIRSELILAGVSGPANAFLPSDVFAIEVTTGVARALDPVPRPTEPGYRPRGRIAYSTGKEVLLVTVSDGFPVTIDRLDLETETWAETVRTEMPGLDVSPDATAWTGSELVIANHLGAGVVFDPATGAVRDIPSSDSLDRFPAVAVTSNIVSVGDRALDVAAGAWTDVDAVPGLVREFPVTVGFGGAMFVWGGDACGGGASCSDIVDPGSGLIWGSSIPR